MRIEELYGPYRQIFNEFRYYRDIATCSNHYDDINHSLHHLINIWNVIDNKTNQEFADFIRNKFTDYHIRAIGNNILIYGDDELYGTFYECVKTIRLLWEEDTEDILLEN